MLLLFKNLLFTVLIPGTVVIYLPLEIAGDRGIGSGLSIAAAVVLLALGVSIYAWCVWDFASFGRGTPAPIDAPKKLVVRGLYRYSRNPMYLGVLTAILGWAVLFRAPVLVLYAAGICAMFSLFVMIYEEPHLAKVFGAEYEEYRARVGRWLPRLG